MSTVQMLSSNWFYTNNGSQRPRATMKELISLLDSGTITEKTYVWHKRLCRDWTQIANCKHVMANVNVRRSSICKLRETSIIWCSYSRPDQNPTALSSLKGSVNVNGNSNDGPDVAVNRHYNSKLTMKALQSGTNDAFRSELILVHDLRIDRLFGKEDPGRRSIDTQIWQSTS